MPSDLPPPAPDGGPVLTPAPLHLPVMQESICDRGPCRHLHVMKKAMEVAEPMDGSSLTRPRLDEHGMPVIVSYHPDGEPIYEQEDYRPLETLRSCYPGVAPVRLELSNDDPVLECNLWDPHDPGDPESKARERRRAAYDQTLIDDGKEPVSEGDMPRVRGKR